MSQSCGRPPRGWYCTRIILHPGPCAALPTFWTQVKHFLFGRW